jgi:hypothetical protein
MIPACSPNYRHFMVVSKLHNYIGRRADLGEYLRIDSLSQQNILGLIQD